MYVMKVNGTRIILIVFFFYMLLVMFSFSSYAQPDYDFTNGAQITGSGHVVGAQYRYTDVKPGVDVIVTINAISAGVKISDIDAGSGYKEALQPTLEMDPNTKGHLEMLLEFVYGGTFKRMVQLEIPATCIDVDGIMGMVHEYDQITMGTGSYVDYDMIGTELKIKTLSGWVAGENIGGIDYPGRDTSAKQVMFTTVNANQSSITIRVGADNMDNSPATRLRSIYFKKFIYSNSFLAQPALMAFRGAEKNGKVKLNWDLITEHHLAKIIIEKNSNGAYKAVGEVWINESNNKLSFNYSDEETLSGNTYYRLKMVSPNGNIQYSNTLLFRTSTNTPSTFKLYPTIINSNATLNIRSDKNDITQFSLVDMSGRLVMQQNITVQEGSNNVVVNGFEKLTAGSYVAFVRNGNAVMQQKITKQ